MNPELTFWRVELLHPLIVHFPIALLFAATAFRAGSSVAPKTRLAPFLASAFEVNLFIGVVAAWVAVWTGGVAEDVVNRVICDPTVTHEHEDLALWASGIFTGALVLSLASRKFKGRWVIWVQLLAMVAGSAVMGRAGHVGAGLVYLQGAGVYHPSPECKEFE